MSTVFVLGANGNTGAAVASAFLDIGIHRFAVAVGHRGEQTDKIKGFAARGARPVQVDLTSPELSQAIYGYDFLFVPPPNVENRAEIVVGVIEAAKKAGIKHIILLSVPAADKEQILFAKQFNVMEKALLASGINFTILRAIAFMENLWGVKDAIAAGSFPQALGEGRYPIITVDDIGRAVAAVALNPWGHANKIYTLTGPESLTGAEQAAALTRGLGLATPLQYVPLTLDQVGAALSGMGMAAWQVGGMKELLNVFANNWAADVSPDLGFLLGEIGRRPTRLEEWAFPLRGKLGGAAPAPAPAPAGFVPVNVPFPVGHYPHHHGQLNHFGAQPVIRQPFVQAQSFHGQTFPGQAFQQGQAFPAQAYPAGYSAQPAFYGAGFQQAPVQRASRHRYDPRLRDQGY